MRLAICASATWRNQLAQFPPAGLGQQLLIVGPLLSEPLVTQEFFIPEPLADVGHVDPGNGTDFDRPALVQAPNKHKSPGGI